MTARDELLAALLAERYGPPPLRDPAPADNAGDDDLSRARRRRALNTALDAPPEYRRGVRPTQEAN